MYNYQDNYDFLNNIPQDKKLETLYSPSDGYNLGNLFMNLYEGYKNYKPIPLKPTNDKELLFFELSKYAFAMHELNLYLDVNNDDESLLMLFNDYLGKYNDLLKEYENMYGPIELTNNDMNNFVWEKQDWPWEVEKNVGL